MRIQPVEQCQKKLWSGTPYLQTNNSRTYKKTDTNLEGI